MRNERGLTLIELLAALAISTLIIGASVMLFTSVNQMFNDKAQNFTDESQAELAINTIAKELSGASAVIYFNSRNELRIKSAIGQNRYYSLIYSSGNKHLTLYDFAGPDADFLDPAISISSNAGKYTRARQLAQNMGDPPKYRWMKSDYTLDHLTANTVYRGGELLELTLRFPFERVLGSGKRELSIKDYTTRIKLLGSTSK
jgi:prepilin-type N-terminal cleavage/methylation domain-containing protein